MPAFPDVFKHLEVRDVFLFSKITLRFCDIV